MHAQLTQTKPVNLSDLLPSVRSLHIHDKMRLIRILAEDVEAGLEPDSITEYQGQGWDDEGELRPEFIEEMRRRDVSREAGEPTYSLQEVKNLLGLAE